MKQVFNILALACGSLLLSAPLLTASGQAQQSGEWQDAALSRRNTAEALKKQATDLLEQAQNWRKKAFISNAERRRNFGSAGDAEFKAGEIEEAASLNFTKEAENWKRAAEAFDEIPDTVSADTARSSDATARDRALASLQNAAGNFTRAAEAYGDTNAGNANRASSAQARVNAVNRRLTRGSS